MPATASRSRRPVPRGFTRIDQPEKNTHGWFVRVGYFKRRDGSWKARHVAFFSDAGHGGKTRARRAAEVYVARAQRQDRKAAETGKPVRARKAGKTRKAPKAASARKAGKTRKAAGKRKTAKAGKRRTRSR
jgi:hypothetical protein